MSSIVLKDLQTFGPERCDSLSYEQAHRYTEQLATSHYENFSVVSWLLPRSLRGDFSHVYAFCRWADDLGDETGDRERSTRLLDWWRDELALCYQGKPRHPVFVALWPTIERCHIPRKPFDDLIDAFLQDQQVTRYQTWAQVVDYCTRSADPVGRLVLYLTGYRDQPRQRLADATCTALQLTNFWQDVRRDVLERDRVYVPGQIAGEHGLEIEQMVAAVKADAAGAPDAAQQLAAVREPARRVVQALVERTWPLFEQGRALWPMVARPVRSPIQLFSLGGESILRMIEKQGCDTLVSRPRLGKRRKAALMFRALAGKLLPFA